MSSTAHAGLTDHAALLSSAELRRIEAQYGHLDLMRRAGKAAAEFLMTRSQRGDIVLVAGPRNNSGDAFACAAGFGPAAMNRWSCFWPRE